MPQSKKIPEVWKKIPVVLGGLLFILMAMLLLYFVNTKKSQQSFPASFPTISFQGQYKIADGDWIPVKKGQHIPATRGDVTLKGQFHMASPEDGAYLRLADGAAALHTDRCTPNCPAASATGGGRLTPQIFTGFASSKVSANKKSAIPVGLTDFFGAASQI